MFQRDICRKTMNKKTIHLLLHTIARYFLASIILMYAVVKILGTQFTSQPYVWDTPIGELNGFNLTWFYYGYSYWYGVFIASSQIIAALLLYFRQTTRIGIILYLSIMVNILVLDFAYEINGAKGMAIILTLVAVFVLFSEFKGFYAFFIQQPPLFQKEDRPQWLNKIQGIKYVFIPIVFIGLFVGGFILKDKIMAHNDFFGSWKVENYQDWDRIYFQSAHTFSIRSGCELEEVHTGIYEFDKETNTIEFQVLDKDYAEEEDIDILNPDKNRMSLLIKANYQLDAQQLSIQNDTLQIDLLKVSR